MKNIAGYCAKCRRYEVKHYGTVLDSTDDRHIKACQSAGCRHPAIYEFDMDTIDDNENLIDFLNLIQGKVEKAVKDSGQKKVYVQYRAYRDESGIYLDNLNEVAVPGKAVFVANASSFWGGDNSKSYKSRVVENPTWLKICILANAMICCTRDRHHCSLKGVDCGATVVLNSQSISVCKFLMGS